MEKLSYTCWHTIHDIGHTQNDELRQHMHIRMLKIPEVVYNSILFNKPKS